MNNIKLTEFKLIGLKLEGKTTNSGGQSSKDCGNLWQEFEKKNFAEQIPDKISNEIYAVYYVYEGDQTEPFSYFIGCKVKLDTETPQGMDSLVIPEQNYEKVTAKGKIPDCISKSWESIWGSEIKRSYKYDFEVYDERSKDWNNAEIDIFISIN